MWKLWKTQQPSASVRAIAAIPVPGENPDHQIDADVAMADHREPVG
jgi:hypothetical protein